MATSNEKISRLLPNRPTPITADIEALEYAAHIAPEEAVRALMDGHYVIIADQYSSGLKVLEVLKKRLATMKSRLSFSEQRSAKNQYRTISHRLLLEISSHQLTVRKAPKIGWLKLLYPDISDFVLPFPEVQGLNSSWQWYENGIVIPGLKQKLHPFYGTYFPTRFEHIELFEEFLSKYMGNKAQVIDIGIGSGVLSYMLKNHGFEKIIGTDTNPNALIGVHKNQLSQTKATGQEISLRKGDLFANSNQRFDLIVFNPPWIPVTKKVKGIDSAMYYEENLFPRFFDQAAEKLKPNAQIVLIFSNLARLMDERFVHPIDLELNNNNRFKKVAKLKKKAGKQSDTTKRNAKWRDEEVVELWVLELK